ncbi:DUF4129 domain-containing protein [Haladaptatus cibarius]|uniref:DUF4129 domain-containing protein n=1 Tax=Haladaptatus cibarius TaxID=453847 RepID=UPI000678C942|nr:DUF4129 domain-containing protein [Haladaptatus cibarius]
MNTDRLLTAGIALCCIFAIGTSASTLGSSVDTNPDDVIDVNYESLPINPDDAGELKQEAQSKGEPQSAKSQNDQQQSQSNQKQQSSATKQQQKQKQSEKNASKEPLDFLDRLMELLQQLLQLLIWVVPFVAVAGGIALGVRFGGRLFDSPTEPNSSARSRRPPPPEPNPSNEIERAWWSMVKRFGVEQPHTKTPGECAREAVDAGADRTAAETLTQTFEEVRYGGAPITDDRLSQTRNQSDRLGGGQ